MVVIGVDPHKSMHTASAMDPVGNKVLAVIEIDASLPGYRRLWRWAAQFEERRWAIEGARGLGRHLAQWLVARDERVDDVASTATARVRELSRGGWRKNDVIDAAAAASVAALGGDASPVTAEDTTAVLGLLDERRANLVAGRTRLVNQLHALLRDLIPGGAPTNLTVTAASRVLSGVRPAGPAETARKALARELVRELRETDRRITAITAQITATVTATGSSLTSLEGVGPVLAGRFLARTRDPRRFPSRAAFACYAGVAPVEVASAGHGRHRLPRGGDRQLNLALHLVAVTQVRMRTSAGRAYYDKKIGEGKTHNEAMRCLKRRLADVVFRTMTADQQDQIAASPGGHTGAALRSSAAGPTPTASSSDKSLPGPTTANPTPPPQAA